MPMSYSHCVGPTKVSGFRCRASQRGRCARAHRRQCHSRQAPFFLDPTEASSLSRVQPASAQFRRPRVQIVRRVLLSVQFGEFPFAFGSRESCPGSLFFAKEPFQQFVVFVGIPRVVRLAVQGSVRAHGRKTSIEGTISSSSAELAAMISAIRGEVVPKRFAKFGLTIHPDKTNRTY